jgi:hypothetical protein
MPTRRGFIAASALAASSLVPISSSVVRALTTNEQNFLTAWQAFNQRDWATLKTVLADDVVMLKVSTNQSISTKKEVIHYMKNFVVGDNEKFDPTGTLSGNNYTPQWNGNYSIVSGTADWQDADNPSGTPTILPIFYRFRFDSTNKINRMYGSKD